MNSLEENIDYLNKEKFNSYSIPKQIDIINYFIQKKYSVSYIAKHLGYNETTLRDRYKRAGYTRVSSKGIFVPNDKLEFYRAKPTYENKENNKTKETNKISKQGANNMSNIEQKDTQATQATQATPKDKNKNKNLFNLLPAKQGIFNNATELNNATKSNLNIRNNKELSKKLLSIYNFLTSLEPEAKGSINYTVIISGALNLYFEKLRAEYGELFDNYIIQTGTTNNNINHHKAIADLLNLISTDSK